MKIAFINHDFGLGGLQRVVGVVGEELQKITDFEAVYFYSLFSNENYYELKHGFIDGSIIFSRNKVIKKICRSRRLLEQVFNKGNFTPSKYVRPELNKLIKFIKKEKIDVSIFSGPDIISYIPYIQEQVNIYCVSWLHSEANTYLNKYSKGFRKEFIKGLQQSDAAVCLTQKDLNEYQKYNRNTMLIYNPLTIDNTQYSTLNYKNISFTGRLAFEAKGIDYLIEIAKKLPKDWTVSIAGRGSKVEEAKFARLIKKNQLQNKVLYLGPLKKEQLKKHYLYSSIYLMTSRWEGFGLVLAEAMSFGLPIIAFEQNGSNEILQQGKYGILIPNGDVSQMVSKIKWLVDSPEVMEEMQQQSLDRVKRFELDSILANWVEFLLPFNKEKVNG